MTDTWLTVHRILIRWLALLVPVAVGAGLGQLRSDLRPSTAAMILVLPVVAASATGHVLAGVIASLASAAAFDVFLTEPCYSFSIHRRDDVELAIVLVGVGLAVTAIAQWGRRQQEVAQRREGYLIGLAQLLDLPPETTVGSRAKVVGDAITSVLGADRCSWEARAPHGDDAVVGSDGEVTLHGRRLPVEHAGLATEGYTAIPARREAQVLGHFRVTASTHVVRPTGEQLRVAVLLADPMAGAHLHL